jgi:predicted TIM-barrel fold metal-dependent hydrolase
MKTEPMPVNLPVPMLGVDAHAHVFSRDLQLVAGRRYSPDYDATLGEWLQHLDSNGLSHGVLVQPSFLGTDNSHLLRALAAAPERLRGVAVVDPAISRTQLERMARLGVVGIRLNLMGQALPDLCEAQWQPLFEAVAELGWHVELHRPIEDIPALCAALARYGCKVVVDHFGRPRAGFGVGHRTFADLLALGAQGNVWVKVSGVYRLGGTEQENLQFARDAVPLLIEHFGCERLVWGSDWPHTQHESQVDYAGQFAFLDTLLPWPAQRQAVLCQGAQALFGFE